LFTTLFYHVLMAQMNPPRRSTWVPPLDGVPIKDEEFVSLITSILPGPEIRTGRRGDPAHQELSKHFGNELLDMVDWQVSCATAELRARLEHAHAVLPEEVVEFRHWQEGERLAAEIDAKTPEQLKEELAKAGISEADMVASRRELALKISPELAADLASQRLTQFKFGDEVQCRSMAYGEWLKGFYFIAYVPQFSCPYLVKGDLNPGGHDYPLRAHKECRPRPVMDDAKLKQFVETVRQLHSPDPDTT
jgi:hypothetical protein